MATDEQMISRLEQMKGEIHEQFLDLANDFQGMAVRQSKKLEKLYEKLRGCKRLIKKFNRELKDAKRNPPEVLKQFSDEKRIMASWIKELESYLTLRKTCLISLDDKRLELFAMVAGANDPTADDSVPLETSVSNQELIRAGIKTMDETDLATERSEQTEPMGGIVNDMGAGDGDPMEEDTLVEDHGPLPSTMVEVLASLAHTWRYAKLGGAPLLVAVQRGEGFCLSYAITSLMEAKLKLDRGTNVVLSRNQCKMWLREIALKDHFMTQPISHLFACLKILGAQRRKDFDRARRNPILYKIKNYRCCVPSRGVLYADMVELLETTGPLLCVLPCTAQWEVGKFFIYESLGEQLRDRYGDPLFHAVVITGHGIFNKIDCFGVLTSEGRNYGDNGYTMVSYKIINEIWMINC